MEIKKVSLHLRIITSNHMKYLIIKAVFLLFIPLTSLAQDAERKAERHEFVKRGNHKQELALGDYVVVGVFKSEENARKVVDEYKKESFSEASAGYCTAKSTWYVCIGASSKIEEARASRDKYRQQRQFKDAWLLTVHE
jgi:hypothetical protein